MRKKKEEPKKFTTLYNIKSEWACGNTWITQSLIPHPGYVSKDLGCGECEVCKKRGSRIWNQSEKIGV